MKILIIEDDVNIARLIELELGYEGYQVFVAHDGNQGLDLFKKARARVHFDDDLVHLGELCFGGSDNEIGTFRDYLELVVSDERRYFDDDVAVRLQSGHLKIHPNEHGAMLLAPADWQAGPRPRR